MATMTSLPPALRSNPTVSRIVGQLQGRNRQVRELREEAANALTPAEATVSTQCGALAAGAAMSFLSPDKITPALLLGGLGAIAAGAVWQTPHLVAAGNGMLAPMTAIKFYEVLTQRKADAAAAQAPPNVVRPSFYNPANPEAK